MIYTLLPVIGFVLFALGYYYFQKSESVFQAKASWWINGFSIFAVQISVSQPLLYSGVIHSEGVSGLWLFWSAYLVSGFLPFVFAPLWAKLKFITDNQFLLFRFSGLGGKVIHIFRAVYVGWIIVAFLMSFHFLSFLKIIVFITDWDRIWVIGVLSVLVILLSFKNRLDINIRFDFIMVLFGGGILMAALYLFLGGMDASPMADTILPLHPVFPEKSMNLWVLLFVQTWSVYLFDGSGIEAQRFFSTKRRSEVWKVAVLSTVLTMGFSLLLVLIIYMGANTYGQPPMDDQELWILYYLQEGVPTWFAPMLLIGFLSLFITSYEGLLNWGASYLSVDFYSTYINQSASKEKRRKVGMIFMVVIVCTSLLITYFNDSLEVLVKVFFSISAGVAPVFVLRWFWLRINGWSQLTAMLASGCFTLFYKQMLAGSGFELDLMEPWEMSSYSIMLLFVTLFTTLSWVLVTFLTQKDGKETLNKFKLTVYPNYSLRRALGKAILFGLFLTGFFVLVLLWFGS